MGLFYRKVTQLILILAGSIFLIIGFQNCSQTETDDLPDSFSSSQDIGNG